MIAREGRDVPGAPGCLPSPSQRLLLRAACLPADPARDAWSEWKRLSDLRSIDPVSARFLPWIYTRRADLGLTERDLQVLEPGYRFAWLKNQRLLNRAETVVLELRSEGIDTIFLKGLPLLVEAYGDEGARYMEDFDLMLREDQVEHAVAALGGSGWTPSTPDDFTASGRAWRHSSEIVHESGLQCDIHWRLMRRPYRPVSESPLWIGRREFTLRGVTAFVPAVEHSLLHLIVHGMSWQRVPPIRWVLDTHLLLRRHKPDWEVVLAEAARRGVVPALREALSVYVSLFPGEIPEEIVQQAWRVSVAPDHTRAYEQITGPYHEASLRARWGVYRSSLEEAQIRKRIPKGFRGAATHFYQHWLADLPARLLRK